MKKTVEFTKEIDLKTMVSKVTNISLEHTLKANKDNNIDGYFIIDGKYKMTPASQIDEEFSYKIPVDIEIDSKYDISNVLFDIDDFTYEIVGDDKIKLDIVLSIDNLEEKEDIIESIEFDDNTREEDLFLETTEEQELDIPYNDELDTNKEEEMKEMVENSSCSDNDNNKYEINNDSLFSSFKDSAETFKTYSVYILKEDDTLNSVMQKYNIDKESLEEYNDLGNITSGSKIIIPSGKNE